MYRSPFTKQNELIRSLRKQLEASEQEVANQKWLLEQYLKSPSWRMTSPVRWLAREMRSLRSWIAPKNPSTPVVHESTPEDVSRDTEAVTDSSAPDLKQFFTDLYRIQLRSFLTSKAAFQLPSSEAPEISVLLVLFNRAELTLACLRSLAENYSRPIEIIIVDNNSQDETGALLDCLCGARVLRNEENRNFLLAVNQAAKYARGDYLLLLNNDAQILPGTLECAMQTIRSAPDIGAVGGRIILLDGVLQEAGSIIWRDGSCAGYGRGDNPMAPMYMFRRDVDYCSGAFLLTPRRLWEEMNGFDEAFKPAYYEETDYCARLWERNLRVVYEPNAVVLHYEFASSASVHGATDLQRQHRDIFAARHEDLLERQLPADVNALLPARMRDRGQAKVLFIDDRVPHAWLGSGFPRSRAMLLALLQQSCFLTFYPLSEFNEDWPSVYSDMPAEIEFMMGYGPQLLEPFLRNRRRHYDAIFVSRPHNMQIVKRIVETHRDWFDGTKVVYDAEAIFASREIALRELQGAPLSQEDASALVRDEVRLASAASCVLAVSERDRRDFLRSGIENVAVVGHSISPAPTPRPFHQRTGLLFVGAIHEEISPNADSMIWFLEEILPRIQRELGSEAVFTIAGVNRSERVKQLATAAVHIPGHVADLTDLYDSARIFVAPTRYAAGVPHKVHEAAARGLPVVTTPLLSEQLGWTHGDPVLVGRDADEFAAHCVELYANRQLWSKLREAGLERVRRECSAEAFEAALKGCIPAGTRPNFMELAKRRA